MTQTQRDLRVADVELASGATSAALQITQDVVARHPDDAGALARLGNAQSAMGEDDAAENSFHRALQHDGSLFEARFGLARLHLLSDPATALQELTRLADAAPGDPKLLTDLGVANDKLGQHSEAQSDYRQALSVAPGMLSTQVDLGLSLALSDKVDQAMSLLGPLARASDATPKVRQDYALAVTLAGRTDDARTILRQDLSAEQVALAVDAFQQLRSSAQ